MLGRALLVWCARARLSGLWDFVRGTALEDCRRRDRGAAAGTLTKPRRKSSAKSAKKKTPAPVEPANEDVDDEADEEEWEDEDEYEEDDEGEEYEEDEEAEWDEEDEDEYDEDEDEEYDERTTSTRTTRKKSDPAPVSAKKTPAPKPAALPTRPKSTLARSLPYEPPRAAQGPDWKYPPLELLLEAPDTSATGTLEKRRVEEVRDQARERVLTVASASRRRSSGHRLARP